MGLTEWLAQNWPFALLICAVWIVIGLAVAWKTSFLLVRVAGVVLAVWMVSLAWHVLVIQRLVS